MTLPDPSDMKQPKPLRLVAAVGALVTLAVGGLPAFGVPLDGTQIGIITGLVGAMMTIAVVLIGEPQVTPLISPRDAGGNRLVPQTPFSPSAGQHALDVEDEGTFPS